MNPELYTLTEERRFRREGNDIKLNGSVDSVGSAGDDGRAVDSARQEIPTLLYLAWLEGVCPGSPPLLLVQGYLAHKKTVYRGTSIIRKRLPLGPSSRP